MSKNKKSNEEEIHPLVKLENEILQLEADIIGELDEIPQQWKLEQKRFQLLKEICKGGFRYLYFLNENKLQEDDKK